MSQINISVPYLPANPIAVTGTIQRVDTPGNPVINVPVQTTYPANLTPNGVDNGQYAWSVTPVYPDGRTCTPLTGTTPACPNMIAVSGQQVGNNIVVTYTAPPGVPMVRVTINTPNGGSFTQDYTNGNAIVYPYPVGLYGAYNISMQAICDPTTGFLGPSASGGTVTIAAPVVNPSLTGNVAIFCGTNCSGQQDGNLVFNLTQPLSADLTVQLAYTLQSPSGSLEPIQQFGTSIIPNAYLAGTAVATGYATFVIPSGTLQVTIPAASIMFAPNPSIGGAAQALICFCPNNPLYNTTFVTQLFIHPTNQPNIQVQLTATDSRITVIQV